MNRGLPLSNPLGSIYLTLLCKERGVINDLYTQLCSIGQGPQSHRAIIPRDLA